MLPGATCGMLPGAAPVAPRRRRRRRCTGVTPRAPPRQLSELPQDELEHLAEEFGLDPTRYKTRQHLVAAIHDRRQMIAAMDREAMLDVVRWGRRPVTVNATQGADRPGDRPHHVDALRRAVAARAGRARPPARRRVRATTTRCPLLVKRLKKQEGLLRQAQPQAPRRCSASMVANIVGEDESADRLPVPPARRRRRRRAPRDGPPRAAPRAEHQGGDRGVRPVRRHRQPHQEVRRQLRQPEARRDRGPHRPQARRDRPPARRVARQGDRQPHPHPEDHALGQRDRRRRAR